MLLKVFVTLSLLALVGCEDEETCAVESVDQFQMLDDCLVKSECHLWPNQIREYGNLARICHADESVKLRLQANLKTKQD